MLETMGRHWWVMALRGLVAILFGLMALAWPGITIAALVILFGVYAFLDGVMAIVASVRLFGAHARWWPALIVGVLGVLAGIVAFAMPIVAAVTLLYLVAIWAIVTGIFEIVAAVQLRREIAGEWLLALGGVISVALGILLFAYPGAGLIAWAWMIGIYALFFGVLLVALAFRLRALSGGSTDMRLHPQL